MKQYISPKIKIDIYLSEDIAFNIFSIFIEGEVPGGENDSWDEEEEW